MFVHLFELTFGEVESDRLQYALPYSLVWHASKPERSTQGVPTAAADMGVLQHGQQGGRAKEQR